MAKQTTAALLEEIEKWATVYEFSFQFWGEGENNVFINKHHVEVASFGNEKTVHDILARTMEWVKKENAKGYKAALPTKLPVQQHCHNCGANIDRGEFCDECADDYFDLY